MVSAGRAYIRPWFIRGHIANMDSKIVHGNRLNSEVWVLWEEDGHLVGKQSNCTRTLVRKDTRMRWEPDMISQLLVIEHLLRKQTETLKTSHVPSVSSHLCLALWRINTTGGGRRFRRRGRTPGFPFCFVGASSKQLLPQQRSHKWPGHTERRAETDA